MTYLDQWKALAGRIRGLTQAGQLYADYLKVRSSDSFGRAKALRQQSASILTALEAFRDRFRQSFPPAALAAVENFISQNSSPICNAIVDHPDLREESAWAALVMSSLRLRPRSRSFYPMFSNQSGFRLQSALLLICNAQSLPMQRFEQSGRRRLRLGRWRARSSAPCTCCCTVSGPSRSMRRASERIWCFRNPLVISGPKSGMPMDLY